MEERNPGTGCQGGNTPDLTISAKKIIRYIAKVKKEINQQRGCSTGHVLNLSQETQLLATEV